MNITGYHYSVHTEAKLSREEVGGLMECSAHHYDGKCKAAGRVGGFLYGITNMFLLDMNEDDEVTVSFTHDQLQTLTKIVEYSFVMQGHSLLYGQIADMLRDNIRVWKALDSMPSHIFDTLMEGRHDSIQRG